MDVGFGMEQQAREVMAAYSFAESTAKPLMSQFIGLLI
jgi:hypothetical protein